MLGDADGDALGAAEGIGVGDMLRSAQIRVYVRFPSSSFLKNLPLENCAPQFGEHTAVTSTHATGTILATISLASAASIASVMLVSVCV